MEEHSWASFLGDESSAAAQTSSNTLISDTLVAVQVCEQLFSGAHILFTLLLHL